MFRQLRTTVVVALLLSIGVADAAIRPIDTSKGVFRVSQQAHVDKVPIHSDDRKNNGIVNQARHSPSAALSVRGGVANTVSNALGGAVALALIEKVVKKGLAAAKIEFPGQLAACIVLFASLLLVETVSPALANGIFSALTPGSALLAKWLPVFFVPGLVLLPLSKPIGGSLEVSFMGSACRERFSARYISQSFFTINRFSKFSWSLPVVLSLPFCRRLIRSLPFAKPKERWSRPIRLVN